MYRFHCRLFVTRIMQILYSTVQNLPTEDGSWSNVDPNYISIMVLITVLPDFPFTNMPWWRYCSASEVRHPSEFRHLHFMAISKNFYCPFMPYMYTLPLKEAIPFI